ncbi:MAG: hypothetical protein A3F74_25460 [Betaproteobacteria bacterium RIFCSPLOWO2_12_FULL_62_58]|nr:MAG: hypothetical protein A3F74_25460 [Betaproteobacteria bacterium RIFCSPLOWO2_12_FULL_62_58]
MNAPQKISSLLVAPGVALVRPAPTISTQARKRAAARWLKAMCAPVAKPKRTIRDLLREVRW